MKRVVVEAPASSANLGSGFDTFAVALKRPWDRLALERDSNGISLDVRGAMATPNSPRTNVVGAVAKAVMSEHAIKSGVKMHLSKGVPVGAGLGSSAASSVAAAVGISALFHLDLSPPEIIKYAGVGEKRASGAAHYDNVTASYAGGFVIVTEECEYVRLAPPASLALCLVTPNIKLPEKKTEYARSLLPRSVSLKMMLDVTKAASLTVHGFATGDIEEIGKGMAVSPTDEARARMIPRFEQVKKAALAAGAAGVCISGAGPTVLAAAEKRKSQRVMEEMTEAFRGARMESKGFVTEVGGGCRVVEE